MHGLNEPPQSPTTAGWERTATRPPRVTGKHARPPLPSPTLNAVSACAHSPIHCRPQTLSPARLRECGEPPAGTPSAGNATSPTRTAGQTTAALFAGPHALFSYSPELLDPTQALRSCHLPRLIHPCDPTRRPTASPQHMHLPQPPCPHALAALLLYPAITLSIHVR